MTILPTISFFIAGQEWIFLILLIIALPIIIIIAIVVFIVKRIPNDDKKRLGILKDRLANGDITQKEFDKLKKGIK